MSERTESEMEHVIRILISRLVGKGIAPNRIPACIRDLFNTISININMGLYDVNKAMARLGWDEFELDDHTHQLISAFFETDNEYKRTRERLYELKGVHAR